MTERITTAPDTAIIAGMVEIERLRRKNARLREALKDIREYAELRSPSMRLIALQHIEEIVDTTLQEDSK